MKKLQEFDVRIISANIVTDLYSDIVHDFPFFKEEKTYNLQRRNSVLDNTAFDKSLFKTFSVPMLLDDHSEFTNDIMDTA